MVGGVGTPIGIRDYVSPVEVALFTHGCNFRWRMYPQQAMAHRGDKRTEKLNPDEKARIHVGTNGSLLTEDYMDELAAAGMTDAGIDLKGIRPGRTPGDRRKNIRHQ